MVYKIFIILFIFCGLLALGNINIVSADYNFIGNSGLKETGIGTGHTEDGKVKQDISAIIGKMIQAVLSFLGVIFLVLTIYGGFLWMTARGNEQQIEKSKTLLTAAIIGLFVVVSAYAISYFVINALSKNALGTPEI